MKMKSTSTLFAFLLFWGLGVRAQSTNPAPYCYPAASSMTSGTCTGNYGFNIQSVKLNTLSQSGGCYGSGVNDVYRYWSATISIYAGGKYTLIIQTPQSIYNYAVSAGFWIDLNQNNRFDSVELLGTTLVKNGNSGGAYHAMTFIVPCSATAGKTRLRVRAQGLNKISSADTCKVAGGFGETWDFDVTIVQPSSVSAGFNMPSQAFVKNIVKTSVVNPNEYSWYDWDINNDGTFEQIGTRLSSFGTNSSTWTTSGTKCIKLRTNNCFGSDTIVKCISIVNPSAKPVVGFSKVSPCEKVVELYGGIDLVDTSGQGPYIWKWNIYDSITYKNDPFDPYSDESTGYVVFDNGTTNTSQFPHVSFYRSGLYSVELIATNGIGTSKMTKKSYIKVIMPTVYYLGFGAYGPNSDNRVTSDDGYIMDDGGPNVNYSNNSGNATKSYLIINPPAARSITIKFSQIKLKDANDTILVFDDDKMDRSKLLATITNADNGTTPSYTSTLNKMYFLFRSDGSGTDSGYMAEYSNTGVMRHSGNPTIAIGHNLLFVNQKSVFYNEYESIYGFNYTRIWTVNDTVQTAYTNVDTLQYKFKYAGTQKVCLEMQGCSATYKKCENLVFESGLMGVVYRDNNANCAYNGNDKPMSNIHMKLFDSTTNSWSHYFTNSLGQYNFNKGTGTYKAEIDANGLPFRTICSTPGTDSTFRLTGTTPYRTINFDIGCKAKYDLGVQSIWTSGIVFPGRNHELRVSAGDLNKWFGLDCASGVSGSVVVSVTGKVSYTGKASGTLSPSSVSGNVFTYTISDFSKVNNGQDFGLAFKTDTTAKAGDTIRVQVRVTPLSNDDDTTNNTVKSIYRVRNSLDPNMKEVYPDELTDGYKDWLTYTIHFQNTGNASAFDIRIQDTLDQLLDPQTFQLLNYSHTVSTTLTDRVLSFKFKDIMLPDSNTDSKGSQGFVQYRIKPKYTLSKGAKVENKAFIYFDYNEPVITNTATNHVLPHLVLIPDPAFAAWLTAHYPAAMYKGNLLDTAYADIKKETGIDVSGKNIANLFGIQFFVSLQNLNCSGNQLLTLPALPSSLILLNCSGNRLTTLPALPSMLDELDCSGNQLTSITGLPSYIQTVKCGYNQLEKLPALAATLKVLNCEHNKLTVLPYLFSGLNELYCNDNAISCFDNFASNLNVINISGNKNKCVPNYIGVMDANTLKIPLCVAGDKVNNPDNCKSNVPATVLIPDTAFAAWLTDKYPASMYNGNRLDTSRTEIKDEMILYITGKGVKDLFGVQFFTSLKSLDCRNNLLSGLPQLPAGLVQLYCSGNKLATLPALPEFISDLEADGNELTALPDLSFNLQTLTCSYNKLASLPLLPSSLKMLDCSNNNIVCFEKFSDGIQNIDISANSNKCLPNYIAAMDVTTKAVPLCIASDKVNNPDNCPGKPLTDVRKVIGGRQDVVVYPNPGNGVYHVALPQAGECDIEVFDALGVLVYKTHQTEREFLLNLSGASNGVYMLRISGTDGSQVICLLKS